MNQEIVKKIVDLGSMAPSGGNSQPWQFKIHADTIEVIALPEKDHKILNFRNRGTWIAHGALIENMVIAAHSFGYTPSIQLFPDRNKPNLTARLDFTETKKKEESLAEAIPQRATNRKPYIQKPLSAEEKDALMNAAREIPGGSMEFTETAASLKKLGVAVSVNEIVTFEEKSLHELFVHEVAWTKAEEQRRGGGLFLKTMELAPPQAFVLTHLLRHWNVAKIMNKIGFARFIASGNAKIYAQASAFGVIIVPDDDAAFITAGRIMERVWLEATRRGLQLQLTTGVLFMNQRFQNGDTLGFSKNHIQIVTRAYNDIASCFTGSGTIALLFRIGHGDHPSAYSVKNLPVYI